jgi:hypothetical protein
MTLITIKTWINVIKRRRIIRMGRGRRRYKII